MSWFFLCKNKSSQLRKLALSVVLGIFCGGVAVAEEGYFLNDPDAKKYAMILVGASSDLEHDQQFTHWATTLYDTLLDTYGYEAERVTLLLGNKPKGHEGLPTRGACRRENLQAAFDRLAGEVESRDQLTLFLFGHGSGFGEEAKFNIVGPDVTGTEFAHWLDGLNVANVVVFNTTSASHDFTQAMSAPGRVLLSSTRSRAEKYDTRFPEYLVEALQDHNGDRDKNQRLSALEAFVFAKNRTESFYSDNGILATEHSTIDDNGDGIFSVDPSLADGDGRLAEIAYLNASIGLSTQLSPAAADLKTQMDNLERSIFLLRSQKSTLTDADYWQKMEPLLVDLAKLSSQFRDLNGG